MDEESYLVAVSHIPDGFAPPRLNTALCRTIPIEETTDEPFAQRFEPSTEMAYRREQRLVKQLERHLRKRGHDVTHQALTLPDGTELRTDLFDHDTGLLVEAKASADRAAVRMAIGQLLDYRRHVHPAPDLCAVLLPERPTSDLVERSSTLWTSLSCGHQVAASGTTAAGPSCKPPRRWSRPTTSDGPIHEGVAEVQNVARAAAWRYLHVHGALCRPRLGATRGGAPESP